MPCTAVLAQPLKVASMHLMSDSDKAVACWKSRGVCEGLHEGGAALCCETLLSACIRHQPVLQTGSQVCNVWRATIKNGMQTLHALCCVQILQSSSIHIKCWSMTWGTACHRKLSTLKQSCESVFSHNGIEGHCVSLRPQSP